MSEYYTSEQLAHKDFGFTFYTTGRFPLVGEELWETLESLTEWANDKSSNSRAYEGAVVAVVGDEEPNNGVYWIKSLPTETEDAVIEKVGSAISLEDYQEVEYNEAFVNASAVTKDDTIVEAVNKVESTLSSLVDETIANELTTVKAIGATAEACGVLTGDGIIKYTTKDKATNYLSGTTSVSDAVEELDRVIKEKDEEIAKLSAELTKYKNAIGLTESGSDITVTLDCGTF